MIWFKSFDFHQVHDSSIHHFDQVHDSLFQMIVFEICYTDEKFSCMSIDACEIDTQVMIVWLILIKFSFIIFWFLSSSRFSSLIFIKFIIVTSLYARNVLLQIRNMFNELISFSVASRVMTTCSSRVYRLLLASFDSQSSMIITLRFSFFRIHFCTEEEIRTERFEQKAKRSIETCDVLDSQTRSSKFIIK
jgi:hypothetical protein